MTDELVQFVTAHVQLTDNVFEKMKHEQLSLQSFRLLNENDLRELGFAMGPRKVLLDVIRAHPERQQNTTASVSDIMVIMIIACLIKWFVTLAAVAYINLAV